MELENIRAAHAVICSGSGPMSSRLQDMLLRWACSACVALTVERTNSPALPEGRSVQLLILDMDSVEMTENTRLETGETGLIVISRDVARAIHSYRWHPAAFLKPDFDARRLAEALAACEKFWRRARVCLESPYKRRDYRLPLGQIRYVEAAAHYCLFNLGRQSARVRYGVNTLEALLPTPPFVRCHRSYFVHLDAVERMSYTALKLKSGGCLPLGRTYVKAVRDALAAWQEGNISNDDLDSDLRRSGGGAHEAASDAPEL